MVYGLNSYSMVALFMRGRRRALNADLEREVRFDKEVSEEDLPVVLTQIPLYNEANVAERVIRAVAEIDYPLSKHQIQVLDDSNDETVQIVDDLTAQLNADGHWIDVVRRPTREGFKAGASTLENRAVLNCWMIPISLNKVKIRRCGLESLM